MKIMWIVICMTLCWCLMEQVCHAEKAYVTDSFEITLRTGPGVGHKIIAILRSGEPLEILESKDKWTHVRVEKPRHGETEGWVLTRYLITRTPWKVAALSLKEENKQLNEKLADLKAKWMDSAQGKKDMAKHLKETEAALQKIRHDYESLRKEAAGFLKLKAKYETAISKLQDSQSRLETMTKENEVLRNSQSYKWFGIGALVLLVGLVIGLYFGKQQKKRRPSLYY